MLAVARIAKIVALLAFFMPWAVVSCSGQEVLSMTGVDLVSGHVEAQGQTQNIGLNFFIIIGVIAIVLGLLTSFADNEESEKKGAASRTAVLALVAAGFIFGGMLWFKDSLRREAREARNSNSYERQMGGSVAAMLKIEEQAGYYVTLLSLVGAAAAGGMALGGQMPQPIPAGAEQPVFRPREEDVESWDRIANKDDPDALQEYLLRHPNGRFAELARLKLERLGVSPVAAPPPRNAAPAHTAPAAPPPPPPTVSEPDNAYREDYTSVEPRKSPNVAALLMIAIITIGGIGYGFYAFVLPRLGGETVAAVDPNAFSVQPYEAGEQLHARESGSRYRAMPFARPDIEILGETTAHEPLNITGWVNQPDGHWHQVQLADGRTAYLKATLTVSATTLSRDATVPQPSIPDVRATVLRRATVRSGPGEQYASVFDIGAGDTVYVDSALNNWCMINSADSQWMQCSALSSPPGGWVTGQTVKESCWPNCGD